MARAMVAFWRITKNAGTARQRFSSYEASAKKPRSGTWRIISPCNSLTFAPQSAQNLTNSSKSEAGRPLNMPMRRSRSGERFPACPVTRNSPRKSPTPTIRIGTSPAVASLRGENYSPPGGPSPGWGKDMGRFPWEVLGGGVICPATSIVGWVMGGYPATIVGRVIVAPLLLQ